MNSFVTIKGTKSGIILVLDPHVEFSKLQEAIAQNFSEAANFLGSNNMGLILRGRSLSDEEQQEVVRIITDNSNLSINCIIDEESETEKLFAAMNRQEETPSQSAETVEQQIITEGYDNNARIFSGNLRSGQDISCQQSIVIMGDVKPGATVTSYGSIFILGELRGNAFAGAGGDRNAIVMALKLNPLQVRIADAIAISPDAEKGPKIKTKRKKLIGNDEGPEVAYIEGEHIVKTSYGAAFLRDYTK